MSTDSGGIVRAALLRERSALWRALAAGLLVTLSTVGLAGTSAWLIVRAAQRPVVLSLTVPMGLVQLFALAKAAGRYAERTQTHRAALGVMGRVRASLAQLLEPLIPSGLGPRSADVVDVVLRDVERVQDLLSAVAGPLLTSIVAGLVTVVVSGLIAPWTALSLLVALLLTAVLLPSLAARLGERSEDEMDEVRSKMVALFDGVAQGGDEYLMTGASLALEGQLAALEQRFDPAHHRHLAIAGVVTALTTLTVGVATIVALGLSAIAYREGHVGQALIAIPALFNVAVLELIGGVAPALTGLRGDRAALARLDALRDVPSPVSEPDLPGPTTAAEAAISMTDISHYYGDEHVLANVSLHLAPGDVVVLNGPSGGGKTTLARLLARFLDPTSGSVDLGGIDYRLLQSGQVREHVGFVDDDPHVFSTTLAGNLRIARPAATDDELRNACQTAGLAPFLDSLPEGLETELGGPSTGLSGGEQRRLGVARELLAHRHVVIFDEPTEGLDDSSAAQVLRAVENNYQSGAVLVISHRDADQVAATRRLELVGRSLREQDTDPS